MRDSIFFGWIVSINCLFSFIGLIFYIFIFLSLKSFELKELSIFFSKVISVFTEFLLLFKIWLRYSFSFLEFDSSNYGKLLLKNILSFSLINLFFYKIYLDLFLSISWSQIARIVSASSLNIEYYSSASSRIS